jgi:GR25 family glycosyltransferase involved in LPS biosynthesis
MREQMQAQNLPFEFLDAVDGQGLAETDPRVNWEEVRKYPLWLNRGILGASLSHLAAYERIVEHRLPYAVIVEDDSVIASDFPRVLRHLPDHLAGSAVIMLYYSCRHTLELEKTSAVAVCGRYVSVAPARVDGLQGAVAYAISYAAALSMRQLALPVRVGPDSWGYFSAHKMVDTIRCVYPMCCDHGDGKSAIDYFGRARMKRWLSRVVERTKVFPVYQLLRLKRRRFKETRHRIQWV